MGFFNKPFGTSVRKKSAKQRKTRRVKKPGYISYGEYRN